MKRNQKEGGLEFTHVFISTGEPERRAAQEIMLLGSLANEVLTSALSPLWHWLDDTKRPMCLSEVEGTPLAQGGNLGRSSAPTVFLLSTLPLDKWHFYASQRPRYVIDARQAGLR